jgi:hypothetical protein
MRVSSAVTSAKQAGQTRIDEITSRMDALDWVWRVLAYLEDAIGTNWPLKGRCKTRSDSLLLVLLG